jgi:hypothetical protein
MAGRVEAPGTLTWNGSASSAAIRVERVDRGRRPAPLLNGSSRTPARMLDVHAPGSGDISRALPRYSHRQSLAHSFLAFATLAPAVPKNVIAAHLKDFESFQDAGPAAR